MKKFMVFLTLVLANIIALQTSFAGCPDENFLLKRGSIWFDGPGHGHVHTPGTGRQTYYTVANFNIIADLADTVRLYQGQNNCASIGSCTDSSGYFLGIKNISVYDSYSIASGSGEIQCGGRVLYSRIYR